MSLGNLGSLGKTAPASLTSLNSLTSLHSLSSSGYSSPNKAHSQRVHIVEQMQGPRWAKKRSLLTANEDFEPERNTADAHEMCSPKEEGQDSNLPCPFLRYSINRIYFRPIE